MSKPALRSSFAICVATNGCDDLKHWKLYRLIPDEAASAEGYLRVIDDSGEDYLYPTGRFVVVTFSAAIAQKLTNAAPIGA